MAVLITKPKGTADVLPAQSGRLRFLESRLQTEAALFGFQEIRTPVFEHTELFRRGVGETTDVVQKEMYTFEDNGRRSVTLRPEGTAGCARAFLEHGLFNEPLPQKYYYFTSCYRYEKPQAGRLREFHQFGVEAFGSASPAQDAEVISLANHVFDLFGVKDLRLEINSIGCPKCRRDFQSALRTYFEGYKDQLCETCLSRLERNPMRILDCKSPVCSEIAKGAPKVLDYLCEECETHFTQLKQYLDALELPYTVNPTIVRGLDYYTRTVFEFVSDSIGAQGTVCGGGRYDGLIAELGGADCPACGFGMGMERLQLLLEAQGIALPEPERPELYIAPASPALASAALKLADRLRAEGFRTLTDVSGRSLKAQMKYANKLRALFTTVLGEDEIAAGKAKLKNMDTGETCETALAELPDVLMRLLAADAAAPGGTAADPLKKLVLLNGGK